MKRTSLLAGLLILTGCSSTSPIAPYGKDTFILSANDSMGVASSSQLKVKAAQEASAHCAKMGKVMTVRNTTSQGTQWFTGTSSDLVFSCVAENDVENARPNLRPTPDTMIEVRTK